MRHHIIALIAVAAVGACTSAGQHDQRALAENSNAPTEPAMSLTDMLTHDSSAAVCIAPYEGFYSRVTLRSQYCLKAGECPQASPEINRAPSLLRKLAWPRSQTVTFIAQVGAAPDVAPVPRQLLLLTHNDNDRENGETASAELLVDDPALTPYFLVKPETVVSIAINAKHQSKLSSSAAKMLSRVTLQATKLLAPESALATQLAQPAIRAQADNADKWLGLMFSIQDAETVGTNLSPTALSAGTAQVFSGRLLMRGSREYGTAVQWIIGWEAPRISMFSGKTMPCKAPPPTAKAEEAAVTVKVEKAAPATKAEEAAATAKVEKAAPTDKLEKEAIAKVGPNVDPSQILGFTIAKDKTIRDLVATQSWYRAASTQLSNSKERATGLAMFCGQIPGLMRAQNFNRYDAALILWAALLDTPGFGDPGAALARAPAICEGSVQTLRELGLLKSASAEKQK